MNRIIPPSKYTRSIIREWLFKYNHLKTEQLSIQSNISIRTLLQWKITYDVVNLNDKKLFIAWFNYKNPKTTNAAILLRTTLNIVRSRLITYGLRKIKYKVPNFTIPREHLRDPQKLNALYQKYNRYKLAAMFNISLRRVSHYIRKFDLKSPRIKPLNPYKNKQWLIEHYVNKQWTQTQCARVAGISYATMRSWLVDFNIPRRNKITSHKSHIYDKILQFLTDCDMVVKHKKRKNKISITFNDGMREIWSLNGYSCSSQITIIPYDEHEYPFNDIYPEIKPQYPVNQLQTKHNIKHQFLITHKYLQSFKVCNIRVFFHQLIYKLIQEGPKPLYLPPSEIQNVIQQVKNNTHKYYYVKNDTYIENRYGTTLMRPLIVLQYSEHQQPYWNASKLFKAIKILYKQKKDITRITILNICLSLSRAFIFPLCGIIDKVFGNNIKIINCDNIPWVNVLSLFYDGDTPVYISENKESVVPNNNNIHLGILDYGDKYKIGMVYNASYITILKV